MNPTPSARFIICMSLGLSAFLNLAVPIAAHAQANSWTTTTNGNWEDAANWSLGVPPSMFQSAIFVTNGIAGFKTITINGTNSSTMTISNLTVAGTNFLNTAQLSNGTLVVRNALTITSGGVFRQLGGELIVDGRISINGGTLQFSGPLTISTGTLWITGGQVVVTTNSATPAGTGFNIDGPVILNNGFIIATNVTTTIGKAAVGSLTVNGGTMTSTNIVLGNSSCTATGTIVVAGGSVFVTNVAHTASLEIRSGSLWLNDGTLVVDQLVATNPCASFQQTGGTLVLAGVTNTFSGFRITAIGIEGNNIRITWVTGGGRTNIVQVTVGSGGTFTTNFVNLSPLIILPGSGDVITNYLDVGGATNAPARYYRVRLVP